MNYQKFLWLESAIEHQEEMLQNFLFSAIKIAVMKNEGAHICHKNWDRNTILYLKIRSARVFNWGSAKEQNWRKKLKCN